MRSIFNNLLHALDCICEFHWLLLFTNSVYNIFALSSGARLLNFTPYFPNLHRTSKWHNFSFTQLLLMNHRNWFSAYCSKNQENSTPQPIITSRIFGLLLALRSPTNPSDRFGSWWLTEAFLKALVCHKQRVNVGCFPVALPLRRRRRAQDADEEKTRLSLWLGLKTQEYNISLETTALIAGCCNSCSWCNA